jgi:Domain of unknown function (DUF4865)
MLLMRYDIALAPDQIEPVRRRAAERGPLFDAYPGLAWKLFLLDPADPCYATLYAWREPAAALGFLDGPFFRALVETFGRPPVHLLLPRVLPELPADLVQVTRVPSSDGADLTALEPRDGEVFAMRWGGGQGRSFEVMYAARGSASTHPD